jgi:hypothetical protein
MILPKSSHQEGSNLEEILGVIGNVKIKKLDVRFRGGGGQLLVAFSTSSVLLVFISPSIPFLIYIGKPLKNFSRSIFD